MTTYLVMLLAPTQPLALPAEQLSPAGLACTWT